MNELNKLVSDILNNNEHDTKNAIQQLFHLLTTQPQHHHSLIQKAILFSMENLHEWGNIMKFLQKWKIQQFKRGFIRRMKKRLNEENNSSQSQDSTEEIKRLVEKYWKTRSPKKEENFYKEPIILRNIIRNTTNNIQTISQKIPTNEVTKNQTINQKQQQQTTEQSKQIKNINPHKQQQPSQQNSNGMEKRQRSDPLTSVTGRPPILKKKSIFENPNKPNSQSNQQRKKVQVDKKNLPNQRILNIMKRYADKDDIKSTESWDNFGSYKDPPRKDQDFPPDKFKFGSNKKSNQPQLTKKIPLSPRKYDPTNKIVKIIRNQHKETYESGQNLHQFSFASSQRKQERQEKPPQEQVPTFKTLPQPQQEQPESDKFVFHDVKESQQTPQLKDQNNSIQIIPSPTSMPTPMFVFNQSKKRRSSMNRQIQDLQTDQQLKLYDANTKVRYFMQQIQVRLRMNNLSLFEQQWETFIRNPQRY